MLDRSISAELMTRLWHSLPSQAALPTGRDEFFNASAQGPFCHSSLRQYERLNVRAYALLKQIDDQEETFHAGYLRDASRLGVGIYSPVQLLPRANVTLWIPNENPLELVSHRSRRVRQDCYEIGLAFAEGLLPTREFREIFHSKSQVV